MTASSSPTDSPNSNRVTVSGLPWHFLREHSDTVSAMLLGAARSLLPRRPNDSAAHAAVSRTAQTPSAGLLHAYARWCGAGERYQNTLPPHLVCAKIAMPVISQLTAQSPYPLLSVLNQGVRLRLHAPMPAFEPIQMQGRLVNASDDGSRARIHSQVIAGTASVPTAITIDAVAAVVIKARKDSETPRRAAQPDFETIGQWQARADEGQTFFWLTGDFNPIHTLPAFARRTRFGGCIMHGYGAFAQVFEALQRSGTHIADIDVRFVRPLPLPSAPLLIQRARTADPLGRYAIRLIDTAGTVYQAGHCCAHIVPEDVACEANSAEKSATTTPAN